MLLAGLEGRLLLLIKVKISKVLPDPKYLWVSALANLGDRAQSYSQL